jgi:hypothetical protein
MFGKFGAANPRFGKPGLRGSSNPAWRGGRRTTHHDYILIRVIGRGDRYEHRVVMEAMLGRPLQRSEPVHHRNDIRHDNRRRNLRLFVSNAAHSRFEGGTSTVKDRAYHRQQMALGQKRETRRAA